MEVCNSDCVVWKTRVSVCDLCRNYFNSISLTKMTFSLIFLRYLLVAKQRAESRPTEAETIHVIGICAVICSEE